LSDNSAFCHAEFLQHLANEYEPLHRISYLNVDVGHADSTATTCDLTQIRLLKRFIERVLDFISAAKVKVR